MTDGMRQRSRAAATAEVRRTAIELMNERGFDAVRVEEIAAAAGVSPSTVYRYFGTKEAIVLSADRADALVDQVRATTPAGDAASTVAAFVGAVAAVFDGDESLRPTLDLIRANPALVDAHRDLLLSRRTAVAEAFAGDGEPPLAQESLAAACLVALHVALLELGRAGSRSLPALLGEAFAPLAGTPAASEPKADKKAKKSKGDKKSKKSKDKKSKK